MAVRQPDVEWLVHFPDRWMSLGVINLSGKWAGVEETNHHEPYKVVTPWVDDRKTAIGFLKLLKEN